MNWHYVEKEYYDHVDDIEAVNIHYTWTPQGGIPDWEKQRMTRYMPRVQTTAQLLGRVATNALSASALQPGTRPLRKKALKLPLQIQDPKSGELTSRYLLHHYFEVFQDGHRHYSPLYTEEIDTGADAESAVQASRSA